jgi:hypothetical protein
MTYIDEIRGFNAAPRDQDDKTACHLRRPIVLVIEDGQELGVSFGDVGECLGLTIAQVPSHEDLNAMLIRHRPMAVVAAMDAAGQDGCHVLMTIAGHDRELPVLLIAGEDPAVLGAIDAVEEIWQLTSVRRWPRLLGIGAIVDFLFRAGRSGSCMRLMPV